MENNLNGTNYVNSSSSLCENNNPGASLGDKHPSSLKILEHKRWLISRNASMKENSQPCYEVSPQEINRYIEDMKHIS